MEKILQKILKINLFVLSFLFYIFCFNNKILADSNGINIIKDAEIENYIQTILNDVLATQHIPIDGVKLHLVSDNSINAFVYDGMNIFVNLGLITASNSSDVVYGVLAHESGHIKGVHLVKTTEEIKNNAILSGTIGLASLALIAVSGGRGGSDVAQAGLMASGQIFNRNLLSFTRTQEREADKYALQTLKELGIGTDGVIELFTKLKQFQNKYVSNIDKYSVTHPLSDERIDFFKSNQLQNSANKNFTQINLQHCLCVAKINGFFNIKPNILSNRNFLENKRCKLYYEIFQNISKNNLKESLSLAREYEKLYIETNKIQNSFLYEAIGDIFFGMKDFIQSSLYYNKAYQSNNNIEFLIKKYHSDIFDVAVEIQKTTKQKYTIKDIKKTILGLEEIFDENSDIQIQNATANILAFSYRILANELDSVQDSITSSLYTAINDAFTGKIDDAKIKLSKSQTQFKEKLIANETNKYLIKILQQIIDSKDIK